VSLLHHVVLYSTFVTESRFPFWSGFHLYSGQHRVDVRDCTSQWKVSIIPRFCGRSAPLAVLSTNHPTRILTCSTFRYTFSQSSAICIAEFLKFCLAASFFFTEWRRREQPDAPLQGNSLLSDKLRDEEHDIADSSSLGSSSVGEHTVEKSVYASKQRTIRDFMKAAVDEVPVGSRFGFVNLACFYAALNNLVNFQVSLVSVLANKLRASYLFYSQMPVLSNSSSLAERS
jgi:hypothetical protein